MSHYQILNWVPAIPYEWLASGIVNEDGRRIDLGAGLSEDELDEAIHALLDLGLIYRRRTTDREGQVWAGFSLLFQPEEGWISPEERARLEAEARERRERNKKRRAEFAKIRDHAYTRIIDRDGARCHSCNTKENLTVDHVIAIDAGGSDDDSNLQILCRSCNSSKGSR